VVDGSLRGPDVEAVSATRQCVHRRELDAHERYAFDHNRHFRFDTQPSTATFDLQPAQITHHWAQGWLKVASYSDIQKRDKEQPTLQRVLEWALSTSG
jgi:hypothetical protein